MRISAHDVHYSMPHNLGTSALPCSVHRGEVSEIHVGTGPSEIAAGGWRVVANEFDGTAVREDCERALALAWTVLGSQYDRFQGRDYVAIAEQLTRADSDLVLGHLDPASYR